MIIGMQKCDLFVRNGSACKHCSALALPKSLARDRAHFQTRCLPSSSNIDHCKSCQQTFSDNGVRFEPSQWLDLTRVAPELIEPEQQARLEDNLSSLLRYMSAVELSSLALRHPQVLCIESLSAWFDFMSQYGFTADQITHLMSQAPQALVKATLVTAGASLVTMREAGLDDQTARALVVSYPQLLHSNREDVVSMLRTFARFSSIGISC